MQTHIVLITVRHAGGRNTSVAGNGINFKRM